MNCALRLLSASASTVCATYSPPAASSARRSPVEPSTSPKTQNRPSTKLSAEPPESTRSTRSSSTRSHTRRRALAGASASNRTTSCTPRSWYFASFSSHVSWSLWLNDFDGELRRVALPRLPRIEVDRPNPKLYEHVRRNARPWVACAPVHKLVATNAARFAERKSQKLKQKRAKNEMRRRLGHLGLGWEVQGDRRARVANRHSGSRQKRMSAHLHSKSVAEHGVIKH